MAEKKQAAAAAAAEETKGTNIINLRDKILGMNDLKHQPCPIPEWDCTIIIKEMTGQQRARLLQNAVDVTTGKMDLEKMYPELAIYSCMHPDTGQPIFQIEDRDFLNTKSGAALERIAGIAMQLSGLSSKGVENAVKN
jgi:hypothetical protein